MKRNPILVVKGDALATYLQKFKISKCDFLDALAKDDPYFDYDDEDGVDIADGRIDSVGAEFFAGNGSLNEDVAKRFFRLIGADDAYSLISWEDMDCDSANYYAWKYYGMLLYLNRNADKSKAI